MIQAVPVHLKSFQSRKALPETWRGIRETDLDVINNIPGMDITNFLMMDDGTGTDVEIPSVLISYEDGKILKDFIRENEGSADIIDKLRISIDFEMVAKRKARVDLFYTASDINVYTLLAEFAEYQSKFEHKDVIVPHLISFSNPFYNASETIDYENCLGKGKFCAEPINGFTAENIIYENIRQMCVYKQHDNEKAKKDTDSLYWKYMTKYKEWCVDLEEYSKDCSESILDKYLTTHSEDIKKCVEESFKDTTKTQNTILETEQANFNRYELHLFPSVLVNYRTFMSSWTSINLLEAVCSGVLAKPDVCYEAGVFTRKNKDQSSSGLSAFSIIMIILLIIVVNAVIYILCRRYITKSISDRVSSDDIDQRINTVVSSYIQFKDQNKLLDGQQSK